MEQLPQAVRQSRSVARLSLGESGCSAEPAMSMQAASRTAIVRLANASSAGAFGEIERHVVGRRVGAISMKEGVTSLTPALVATVGAASFPT